MPRSSTLAGDATGSGQAASVARVCAARWALLLMSVAVLFLSACLSDFALGDKDRCVTNADCLEGWRCVATRTELGVCIQEQPAAARDGGTDGEPSADASPDAELDTVRGPDARPGCRDDDRDGHGAGRDCERAIDCDDTAQRVYPGAPERCNEIDDDCDGRVDEDFDTTSDVNHCGGCGSVCVVPRGEPACVEGACRVASCDLGFVDRNGRAEDGCEAVCAETETRCDNGVDDDCDGVVDAADRDCDGSHPFADRIFHTVWFHEPTGRPGVPELLTGAMRFSSDGGIGLIGSLDRAAPAIGGRGEEVSDLTWIVGEAGDGRPTLRGDDSTQRFPLVRADGRDDVYAGVYTAGSMPSRISGDGWLLMLELRDRARDAVVVDEVVGWLISPYHEMSSPPGGATALGPGEPAEIAQLLLGTPTDGVGDVVWPFSEYRERVDGEPDGDTSLTDLDFTLGSTGGFALRVFGRGRELGATYTGAATSSVDLGVAVLRRPPGSCGDRANLGDQCVPEPTLLAMIERTESRGAKLVGDWELVGVGYDPTVGGDQLAIATYRTRFSIAPSGAVEGSGVRGTAGTLDDSETFLPPSYRISLSGSAIGGPELGLEGYLTADGEIGLFWDHSSPVTARRLEGGIFLLMKQ